MVKRRPLQKVARLFGVEVDGYEASSDPFEHVGRVVPDARRCVQCGVCSYNCPLGIPVRDYARQGLPVENSDCITCGQCIQVCPRGTLRWQLLSEQE